MAHARFLVYSGHRPGVAAGGRRPWFRWRLVSANNRALGQSATVFDDLPACRASMAAATELTGTEELRLVSDVSSGLWTWELVSRREVLAVSARSYERQRECRQSAVAFRDAAPGGSVRAELLIVPGDVGAAGTSFRRGLSLTGGR
jgi:hypothetical protein